MPGVPARGRRRLAAGRRWSIPTTSPRRAGRGRRRIAAGTTYEHEHRLRMADGSWRWHLSRGVPMAAPATGEPLWYGTATDIHDVRDAEERLRGTQSALALAMRGGRMGWWQRDLLTEEVTWSPELEELFGLAPAAFAGDESVFLAFVHPDDRPAIGLAVADAIATGGDYVVEFRFKHADGSWRWMEGRGRATYEDGQPTKLYGIGIDITERKQTEETIRAREERLRIAAEVGGFGLYDYDLVEGGMYWSPELHRILGTHDAVDPGGRRDPPRRPGRDAGPVLGRPGAGERRRVRLRVPDAPARRRRPLGGDPRPDLLHRARAGARPAAAPLDRRRPRHHGAQAGRRAP